MRKGRRLHVPLLLWWRLHRQLRQRSARVRESGAFLLGCRGDNGVDRVRRFACYDDLDPTCLSRGFVDFTAAGFARLWSECRRLSLDVLGDVHTHPAGSSQSETDRTHPMISEPGHMALIVANYAAGGPFRFGPLSVHEYEGNYRWCDWSGERRRERLRFTLW